MIFHRVIFNLKHAKASGLGFRKLRSFLETDYVVLK